jgi:hypothetical protein
MECPKDEFHREDAFILYAQNLCAVTLHVTLGKPTGYPSNGRTITGNFDSRLVCFQAPSQNCVKRLLATLNLSVLLSIWNKLAPDERIFFEYDI